MRYAPLRSLIINELVKKNQKIAKKKCTSVTLRYTVTPHILPIYKKEKTYFLYRLRNVT
jgi:hypothetical protein